MFKLRLTTLFITVFSGAHQPCLTPGFTSIFSHVSSAPGLRISSISTLPVIVPAVNCTGRYQTGSAHHRGPCIFGTCGTVFPVTTAFTPPSFPTCPTWVVVHCLLLPYRRLRNMPMFLKHEEHGPTPPSPRFPTFIERLSSGRRMLLATFFLPVKLRRMAGLPRTVLFPVLSLCSRFIPILFYPEPFVSLAERCRNASRASPLLFFSATRSIFFHDPARSVFPVCVLRLGASVLTLRAGCDSFPRRLVHH